MERVYHSMSMDVQTSIVRIERDSPAPGGFGTGVVSFAPGLSGEVIAVSLQPLGEI